MQPVALAVGLYLPDGQLGQLASLPAVYFMVPAGQTVQTVLLVAVQTEEYMYPMPQTVHAVHGDLRWVPARAVRVRAPRVESS